MILFFLKEFFAFAFVCNLPGLTLQVISPVVYLHWHLHLGCFSHLSFLFSCFSWLLSDALHLHSLAISQEFGQRMCSNSLNP